MPKFFVKEDQIEHNKIIINQTDVNHIKNVLRKQIGDNIDICNQDSGKNYKCVIQEINNETIICEILKQIESNSESKIQVDIFQGLPKFDKMELIIQKSVELGAYSIIPINMKRCIVKIEDKKEDKKVQRWNVIAEVASKQCGRDTIPQISNITNIENICNNIKNYDAFLVAYEQEKKNTLKKELLKLKNSNKEKIKIGVLIGPEGGIDKQEIEKLSNYGANIVTLGNRILRTETVALNVLSIIMYELEN